jgi:thiamine-phosphate pyrophosphorylase
MATAEESHCRLCLVTPSGIASQAFAPILDDTLSGNDVASLIITADPQDLADIASELVPIAQAHGVAALIHNDRRIAEITGADGVHIDDGRADLAATVASLHPEKIAGIANLRSRHDALLAGEIEPDYVFFGRLDGDSAATIFDKALELAQWWASLSQIPALIMGGSSLPSVSTARQAGIEFVALRNAVWEHPAGARMALAEANRMLAAEEEMVS